MITLSCTHCEGDRFKFDKSNVFSSIRESSSKFLEFTVDNIPSSDLWIKLKIKIYNQINLTNKSVLIKLFKKL